MSAEKIGAKGESIRLRNNEWFLVRSADGASDIPVFRVNDLNVIEFLGSGSAYTFSTPLVDTAGNIEINGSVATDKLNFKDSTDATKLLDIDLSGEASGKKLTLGPVNTSDMTLHVPQVQTVGGAGMALVQDETTGYIFSYGINAPIGGGNSMMQLANATVGNRAQIKLHSYFNGQSVAGVSTLTSRSGIIGVNTSLVIGQDYSKWTAQAAGATAGSAPISGTFAFKVNSFYQIGVTPYVGSDFHIQMLGSADGILQDKLFLSADGVLKLPALTASQFIKTDASSNLVSVASIDLATEVSGILPVANGGTGIASPSTIGNVLTSDGLGAWVSSPVVAGSTSLVNTYYVEGDTGNDLTADGSISKPFQTIQAAINFVGQPVNLADALRHIVINIGSKAASPTALFSSVYEENLTVPSRIMTLAVAAGTKIGDSLGAGFGNILKEYSSSRRFGASSSELRPCLTLQGNLATARDSHVRIRNGIHIGGTNRTSILTRNTDSVQGNGSNKVTIHLTPGQFTYPITISTPAIRIKVNNTTSYNFTYDITADLGGGSFEATRVSGTNVVTAVETGNFFESDSAGASGITHDSQFVNCYQQGLATCDDGVVNAAAYTAGTEVMYATGSRFFTGIEGRGILLQRWENNTLAGANIVNSISGMNNVSFAGTITTNTFTYATDDLGFMNCRFNAAVPITVNNAAQTVRMDSVTYNSFLGTASTWITNTPIVSMLDSIVSTSRPRTPTAVSVGATNKDYIIGVTSTAAARTITLPLANTVPAGYTYVVKDESGGATAIHITIARSGADTIDGAISASIAVNYGKISLYSNGSTQWFSI